MIITVFLCAIALTGAKCGEPSECILRTTYNNEEYIIHVHKHSSDTGENLVLYLQIGFTDAKFLLSTPKITFANNFIKFDKDFDLEFRNSAIADKVAGVDELVLSELNWTPIYIIRIIHQSVSGPVSITYLQPILKELVVDIIPIENKPNSLQQSSIKEIKGKIVKYTLTKPDITAPVENLNDWDGPIVFSVYNPEDFKRVEKYISGDNNALAMHIRSNVDGKLGALRRVMIKSKYGSFKILGDIAPDTVPDVDVLPVKNRTGTLAPDFHLIKKGQLYTYKFRVEDLSPGIQCLEEWAGDVRLGLVGSGIDELEKQAIGEESADLIFIRANFNGKPGSWRRFIRKLGAVAVNGKTIPGELVSKKVEFWLFPANAKYKLLVEAEIDELNRTITVVGNIDCTVVPASTISEIPSDLGSEFRLGKNFLTSETKRMINLDFDASLLQNHGRRLQL